MDSLKIAFYTDTYLPAVDGVVASILNAKEELERRGHKVYVFTSGHSIAKPMTEIGKNVYAVHGVRFKAYPQYRLALFPFLTSQKLNSIKPDIVHAHTPFMMGLSALAMARVNKIPIVGTFHTFFTHKSVVEQYAGSQIAQRVMMRTAWPYARFFFRRCNLTIAPSRSTEKILNMHNITNTVTVPNGVDTRRFNPRNSGVAIRKRMTDGGKQKIVLYVGRMSREKRIDVILKAARMLDRPDIRFVFVGTGPAAHYYQHMAIDYKLKDNVRFTGFVSQEELPKYYAAADVLCTASTFETQGIVLLEALASGKPIIGPSRLAIKEIIKSGRNGETFTAGDALSLARKIEKVLGHIRAYKETVKTAELYSIRNATDTLLNVYKDVISGNGSSYLIDEAAQRRFAGRK